MENNETDFLSDINQFAKNFEYRLSIKNELLKLSLKEYNNVQTFDAINNWKLCLEMIGKGHLFKSKEVMLIIYCLLTDNCIIDSINGKHIDIDLFDVNLNKFSRFEVIDDQQRYVRLRIFPICDHMIIIDTRDLKKYKVYELYNIQIIKEYYGTHKADFDQIIKDIKLEPKFIGDIRDLVDDFKKLSIVYFQLNRDDEIEKLEKFMVQCHELECKIMKDYNCFYKQAKINKKKLTVSIKTI